MAHCVTCKAPLVNTAGVGFQLTYVCADPNCPSDGRRRLKCPNPKCKGRLLDVSTLGPGHVLYQCHSCTFGFDNQGHLAPKCPLCHKKANVVQVPTGFLVTCPTRDKQPIRVEWQDIANQRERSS